MQYNLRVELGDGGTFHRKNLTSNNLYFMVIVFLGFRRAETDDLKLPVFVCQGYDHTYKS